MVRKGCNFVKIYIMTLHLFRIISSVLFYIPPSKSCSQYVIEDDIPLLCTYAHRLPVVSSVMSWSNPSQPSSVHFLVILLVTVSCTATGQDAGSITHYDVARTADGGHCTWFVARSTLERVALVMTCRCRDGSGKSQGYSCQYDGILDECEKYQTHTKELSDGLVKSIVG